MTAAKINNFFTAGLLLGSNLSDRKVNLEKAMQLIQKSAGLIIKKSSLYKTAAWGNTDQPEFYNRVIIIRTHLKPLQLLAEILNIELQMGRQRKKKWEARIIDIDILYFEDEILELPELQIPHPYIAERMFTLVPLAELEPEWTHPITKKNITVLVEECKDSLPVNLVE